MKNAVRLAVAIVAAGCFGSAASTPASAIIWNEADRGDLSGDNFRPTPITFDVGVNRVLGTMGRDLPSVPVDADIFTVTIPSGQAITSINVLVFEPTNQSFYAIGPGVGINADDPATHLANTLVKGTGDILPQLAIGSYSGGTGITNPIPAGTYTIWFQELSSVVTYDVAYTVAVVPEPAAGAALLPLAVLAARRPARRPRRASVIGR